MEPARSGERNDAVQARTTDRDPNVTRPELRRRSAGVAAATALLALALSVLVVDEPARAAAGTGPGYGAGTAASPHLGSFYLDDGTLVWCARAGDPSPVGAQTGAGVPGENTMGSAPPGVSVADATARANYILNTWGTAGVNNVDAAAVNLTIWHFLDYNNATALTGGVGIRNYYSTRAGTDTAAVRVAFDSMLTMAEGVVAATPGAIAAPAGASMQLTTDPPNSFVGTLLVSGIESAGTVSLANGVFAGAPGSSVLSGIANGSYPIRGVPPGGGAPYSITASGTFTQLGGWPGTVTWYETPGRQVTVGGSSRVVQNYTLSAIDAVPRQQTFAPVVGTRVASPFVQAGGTFSDVVSFSTMINEWPLTADGTYVQVAARGVLYGPLGAAPTESATVPTGTPIAGTATLTTTSAEGPGAAYTATASGVTAGVSAFYTWVWSIEFDDQSPATQQFLADDYIFHDRYGRLAETHLVPSVSSEAQAIGRPGGSMIDTAIINGLLPAAGADLSFAVYRVDPVQHCIAETLLWTNADAPLRVTAPGRYESPAVTVPGFGTYAWIETLRDTTGALIHQGECMLPGELTRADPPIIESEAVQSVEFGGLATDIAIVNGPLPADGETFVTFALYRALEGVAPADTCTDETLVATTLGTPIPVRDLTRYTSPGVLVERSGAHYWIETLWWVPSGWTDAPIMLASGRCGQSSELTVVSEPAISSRSQPAAASGDDFHDTVTVTSLAAGADAELRWRLYRHTGQGAPVCDATTLVFSSDAVAVAGSGTFASPSTTQSLPARYFWVATLRYTPEGGGEQVELAQGACGQPSESTLVTALAVTGGDGAVVPLVASAAVLSVLSGVFAIIGARRRARVVG